MLKILVVKIAVRFHLTRFGMRFVDDVAGLIEQETVGVLNRKFDVRRALLRKTGRESVPGQRHGGETNYKRLTGCYLGVALIKRDPDRGIEQILSSPR